MKDKERRRLLHAFQVEDPMGRAREEMNDVEARDQMRMLLVYMRVLLETHPTASIQELEMLAWQAMQDDEDSEELSRKLSKDD